MKETWGFVNKSFIHLFVDLQGIFISRVTEQGPAAQAGIVVGDKVLSVNGNTLVHADHHRAVEVLKKTGNVITMVVARKVILPHRTVS